MSFLYGADNSLALYNPQKNKKTAHGIDPLHAFADRRNGQYSALAGSTWMAGTALMSVAAPFVCNVSDGSRVLGYAADSRISTPKAVKVDVRIQLNGTVATSVGKANISNVQVRSAANFGGTLYDGAGVDYNVVAEAGTIARDATTTIGDGDFVYVTFTYEMTSDELRGLGQDRDTGTSNYSANHFDRVEILQGEVEMLTASYDTSAGTVPYSAVDTDLYVSAAGLLTTDTGATHKVGVIKQPPSASNGFMLVAVTADANVA